MHGTKVCRLIDSLIKAGSSDRRDGPEPEGVRGGADHSGVRWSLCRHD